MKIKTAEATGLQLDWGLAQIEAKKMTTEKSSPAPAIDDEKVYVRSCLKWTLIDHTDPAVCMGLIEQYSLAFSECDTRHLYGKPDTLWRVACRNGSGYGESELLAKAVARCVIAMRLGDEFECPDELGVV